MKDTDMKKYSLKSALILVTAFLAAIFMLGSCQTVPEDIPADLSAQEYFQRAQEHMDALNWDAALLYLEAFKERFPEDRAQVAAADYQISLVHYKKDDLLTAKEGFEDIIARYDSADAGNLPEWVEVLSRKLLATIEEELK